MNLKLHAPGIVMSSLGVRSISRRDKNPAQLVRGVRFRVRVMLGLLLFYALADILTSASSGIVGRIGKLCISSGHSPRYSCS